MFWQLQSEIRLYSETPREDHLEGRGVEFCTRRRSGEDFSGCDSRTEGGDGNGCCLGRSAKLDPLRLFDNEPAAPRALVEVIPDWGRASLWAAARRRDIKAEGYRAPSQLARKPRPEAPLLGALDSLERPRNEGARAPMPPNNSCISGVAVRESDLLSAATMSPKGRPTSLSSKMDLPSSARSRRSESATIHAAHRAAISCALEGVAATTSRRRSHSAPSPAQRVNAFAKACAMRFRSEIPRVISMMSDDCPETARKRDGIFLRTQRTPFADPPGVGLCGSSP